MASSRPTLAKVALAAGVSKALASNALNGRGRVSEDAKRRVLAAAQRLGYQPNAAARSLRSGFDPIIAMHLDDRCLAPSGGLYPFWRRFVTGALEAAADHGYHVIVAISNDAEQLAGAPADALVSVGGEINAVYCEMAAERPEPHRLTRDEIASTQLRSTFGADYQLAARLVSEVFTNANCSHVTVLTRPGNHPEVDFIVAAVADVLATNEIRCTVTNPDGSKRNSATVVRDALSAGSDGFLNFADQLPTLLGEVEAAGQSLATRADRGVVVANQSDTPNDLTNAAEVFFIVFDGYGTGRQIAEHVISVLGGEAIKRVVFAPSIRRFPAPNSDARSDGHGA